MILRHQVIHNMEVLDYRPIIWIQLSLNRQFYFNLVRVVNYNLT